MSDGSDRFARVVTEPTTMHVTDDFTGDLYFIRHGVVIKVAVGQQAIWEREIWDRPVWFPRYLRSYEARLRRAKRRAQSVMGAVHAV